MKLYIRKIIYEEKNGNHLWTPPENKYEKKNKGKRRNSIQILDLINHNFFWLIKFPGICDLWKLIWMQWKPMKTMCHKEKYFFCWKNTFFSFYFYWTIFYFTRCHFLHLTLTFIKIQILYLFLLECSFLIKFHFLSFFFIIFFRLLSLISE